MVELSSLDVRALAHELRALEDAYIDKVYQTGTDEFVFKIRRPQAGSSHLVVHSGAFAAHATVAPQTPETPSQLAMAFRKQLANARIRRVDQHEFDRVLRLELERHGEPLELLIELFGKGNLILAGPDHRILIAQRTEAFAHRTIKRGEVLVMPPARVNPVHLPRSQFETLVATSDKDVVRFLALDLGLGGDLAEELVHRAGLEKNSRIAQLEPSALDRLWTSLRDLFEQPAKPALVTTVRGVQVQSVPLEAPLFRDAERELLPSLSQAILKAAELEKERGPTPVDDEVARLERQIGHQERGIEQLGKEAGDWERRGHLLFAHYAVAALMLQEAKAMLEAEGWSGLAERTQNPRRGEGDWTASIKSVDAKRARIVAAFEGADVPLDPLQGVEANATRLYDESKRIRAKLENAKAAVGQARARLARQKQAVAAKPKTARAAKGPVKRFWFEPLRWFYTSEGFLVAAGRDAASNEKLVKRHLSTGDRYVHADIHGAPSCVIKCEGKTPGEATLRQACEFGVTYSRAFAQFAAADAYWVFPEQVSKTAESGEFLPRGGFMVRGHRNYYHKLKLEAAVGIVELDGQGRLAKGGPHRRLVGAPPSALGAFTDRVALVERGDLTPTEAAKRLAPLFDVTVDEAVAALPPGTIRIVRLPEDAS